MTQPVGTRHDVRAHVATENAAGETVAEAKQRTAPKLATAHNAAETVLHLTELTAEHIGPAGGVLAVVCPIASGLLAAASVHEDWKAGREIGAARERDIKNTTVLLLARESLGEDYVNAEMGRMQASYDRGKPSDRDAWAISSQKLASRIAAEAGSFDEARRIFNTAADEGKATAARLGLTNEPQIQLQCKVDPQFRRRFESDPIFRHGVEAYARSAPSGAYTGKHKASASAN